MPVIDLLACVIMLKICQETRFLSHVPFLPPSKYALIFQNKILMLGKLQHVDRSSWLWLPSLNREGFFFFSKGTMCILFIPARELFSLGQMYGQVILMASFQPTLRVPRNSSCWDVKVSLLLQGTLP